MREGSQGIRVVIAGGGTGGHLYPGIAVARAILEHRPGSTISFVGTASGLEHRVVPAEGFELDVIRSAGLKGKSIGDLARGLALLPLSAVDAWRVLSLRRPQIVIGVGGYSSGPAVFLAAFRLIPTLLLEQNAVPGLTNRLLAPFVMAAAVSYEATARYFGARAFVSGNPVRRTFTRVEPSTSAPGGPPRLLVFGGSQGAHAINVAMVAALPALSRLSPAPRIAHQTGPSDEPFVRAAYANTSLTARVDAFMTDLDREMTAADLVVCRAGATTIAELALAGRPAILVPLPTATDDHQRRNASMLAQAGAAEVIDQSGLSGDTLGACIAELLGDADRRARMRAAIAAFARPDAADRVAVRALELAR